jgi:hypothetical protein
MRFAIAHLTEREAIVEEHELFDVALKHAVGRDPVRGRGDELDRRALAGGEGARLKPAVHLRGRNDRGDLVSPLALDLQDPLLSLESSLGRVAPLSGTSRPSRMAPSTRSRAAWRSTPWSASTGHPGAPRARLRARRRVPGPVQRALPDEVSGGRLSLDLALDVPPKSVSLQALIGGDPSVVRAHDLAVERAIAVAEERAQARMKVHGKSQVEETRNLLVAKFRHETSRERDPQLHTHALVLNLTMRSDGEWRALRNDGIVKATRYLGAVYRAELAAELQRAGYSLRRRPGLRRDREELHARPCEDGGRGAGVQGRRARPLRHPGPGVAQPRRRGAYLRLLPRRPEKALDARTVLVIDEAGTVPTRQMEQALKLAERADAEKVRSMPIRLFAS